ncbi:MAG: phosphatidylglycerophosphatase A [bacterium]
MKKLLVRLFATGVCSGYSPIWPGTAGSIPAWLIAFFLVKGNSAILGAATIVTLVASVWLSGEAEKMLGRDARKIVIDEWAGMFLTLLFIPYSLVNYVIAFFAFRAFDVVKIPPARQSESLPGGWGVTMDDVVAGIQANIVTRVLIFVLERVCQLSQNNFGML